MTTWLNLAAIALAGGLGSVCRYVLTIAAAAIPGGSGMLGTTIANVIGCAGIGALLAYGAVEGNLSDRMSLAIRVGFLGGLTTFSTFAAESAGLASEARWLSSGLYLAANLFIGWTALILATTIVKGWMA
ncbi:MAG: CrcB family protein [Pirellulaceae bacterium]